MNRLNRIVDDTSENGIMTSARPAVGKEKLEIPLDLSEWCPRETLLAWVKQEAGALDWDNPELVAYLDGHPSYQPKAWLCLLTLGYACGNFESEEIVRLCYADEMFRSLCPGPFPSPPELGRFRRENRGLLKWLLTEVMKRALRAKFALGDGMLPAGLRRFLIQTADVRLDIARHVDRAAHGA